MSRRVSFGPQFWTEVVRAFRAERGPSGEPSREDFQQFDLPRIVGRFAQEWDDIPRWYGHPLYRGDYITGRVAYVYYVLGQLEPDGSVTLIELNIELVGPEDLPDA